MEGLRVAAMTIVLAVLACMSFPASPQDSNPFPTPGTEGSGEREMKALAAAYPHRISQVIKRDGDWAVDVAGKWFFWAHGRILPERQRTRWKHYAPRWDPDPYPVAKLPPIPQLDAQAEAKLEDILDRSRLRPPRKSENFLTRLLGADSRREIKSRLVRVNLLGFRVRVHRRVAGPLRRVAAQCRRLARQDPQAAAFIRRLSHVEGFSYRSVAGTGSRSYHSYGLAVDLIPKSFDGKAVYWRWRWSMENSAPWWATPYSERWMVPPSIVSAFEQNGFVWGGKWFYFDNVHFEYRPEMLILATERAH